MIIVSQDKEKIFVLENLSKIGIDENNAIRPFNLGDKWNELGKYKTKKRAKEALEENSTKAFILKCQIEILKELTAK